MSPRCSLAVVVPFALMGLGATSTAHGRSANDGPESSSGHTEKLDTVVVTGTRVPTRTALEAMAPTDVLTSEDIAATGAGDLDTALRTLLPAFNFPQPSQLGATDATMPAQLRGLSPDETLVLVNGKRRHTTAMVNADGPMIGRGSSPVDLGAIPVNAIARIEVLRDGAAAQYGSDAIAGVINIILKDNTRHGSVKASYGRHDGKQGRTWNLGADAGFALGERGSVHVAAHLTDQNPTNHVGPDPRFPGDPQYNTRAAHYGLPDKRTRQLAINSVLPLGESTTAYAFTLFNKRDVVAGAAFQSLSEYDSISQPAADTYPRGFLPMQHSAIRDDSTVLGMRGTALGWDWDISAGTGGNHVKMRTAGSFNYSLGADSPTAFYDGTLVHRQDLFNADFSRKVDTAWQHPLALAWGLAWRRETFTLKPGEAASWVGRGGVESYGFRPRNAGTHRRENTAAYVDLETDFSDQWSLGLAGRYEHYSDFGDTVSWKLSTRYAVNPTLALRGSVSTGFRAPSLQQQYYASTTTEYLTNSNGYPERYAVGTFPVSDPAARALGAQPLQPEKATNVSLGLVLTPENGPDVTLDLYQVTIRDRIILSGNLVGDAVQDYLASQGITGVNGGRFFNNATDTRTRGADLLATWSIATTAGDFDLRGGLNYNRTTIRAIKPNPPQLGLAGLTLPLVNRPERGRITDGTPRSKAFAAATWKRENWRLQTRVTRYGSWYVRGDTPASDQRYAPRVLLNAAVSYQPAQWRFTLGARNLTNTYPEKNNAQNNYYGVIPYPFSSPFGFNGRYWYMSAAYRW